MKRRIAYKVARAIIAGESKHRPETRRRALQIVRRDVRRGRFEAVILACGLGELDLARWFGENVTGPMMAAFDDLQKSAEHALEAFGAAGRAITEAFARVKLPQP